MSFATFLTTASLLVSAPPASPPGGIIRAQVDAPVLEIAWPAAKGGPVSVTVLAGGAVVHLDCSQCAAAQGELNRLAAGFEKPRSWVARGDAVKASGRLVSRPTADSKAIVLVLVVESLTLIPGE